MQLSILILAPDRDAAQAMADGLTGAGHGVTVVHRLEELASAAGGYSLVIVDRAPTPASPGDAIALLKGQSSTSYVPVLGVAQSDDLDERIALLEAGADEVITKPFQQAELLARVEAMNLGFQRSASGGRGRGIGDPSGRRVIALFSPKGGVGTTTIATNLALLAAERLPGRALLIDLDLSFGQVASHLNLQPKQTLLDLSRDEAALREADIFRTYTVQLPSGLHVLAAPPSPALANLIGEEQVEAALARALEAYEIIVVDAGADMDERHAGLFSRTDTVVIPVIPEIPALNAVRLLLDELSETGSLGNHTMFVLNNVFARDLLKRTDVEGALGARIAADLPYDPISYLKAANEGVPLVLGSPKSLAAEKMRALATAVFGGPTAVASPAVASVEVKKEKRGLFGRR